MLDKARIGLRYGIESALKLEYFVDNLLKSFTGIYQKIESGSKVYNTVRVRIWDNGTILDRLGDGDAEGHGARVQGLRGVRGDGQPHQDHPQVLHSQHYSLY